MLYFINGKYQQIIIFILFLNILTPHAHWFHISLFNYLKGQKHVA